MNIRIYRVDAFTEKLFGGNPAAVCPLDWWLDAGLMQSIAMENNLAETAFIVRNGSRFDIRWVTPAVEVDICGHATLAAAHVVFNYLDSGADRIEFISGRSGLLSVTKKGDLLTLDFPTDQFAPVDPPEALINGIGMRPLETYLGKTDYLAILPSQKVVEKVDPDFGKLATLRARGVIISAEGETVDFVSRFFAPQSGTNEDPVTGSAHTTLIPYWSKRLDRTELTAMQLSAREGHLQCRYLGSRVEISGHAITYMIGEIIV